MSPGRVRHTDTAEAYRMAVIAARAADDKQGVDPIVLQVGEVLAVADAFVITSAGNPRLVRALADEVEHQLKEQTGRHPLRIEGLSDLSWVLLDYGEVVVHVFSGDMRQFYDLERLYRDVPRLEWRAAPAPPLPGRSS